MNTSTERLDFVSRIALFLIVISIKWIFAIRCLIIWVTNGVERSTSFILSMALLLLSACHETIRKFSKVSSLHTLPYEALDRAFWAGNGDIICVDSSFVVLKETDNEKSSDLQGTQYVKQELPSKPIEPLQTNKLVLTQSYMDVLKLYKGGHSRHFVKRSTPRVTPNSTTDVVDKVQPSDGSIDILSWS